MITETINRRVDRSIAGFLLIKEMTQFVHYKNKYPVNCK